MEMNSTEFQTKMTMERELRAQVEAAVSACAWQITRTDGGDRNWTGTAPGVRVKMNQGFWARSGWALPRVTKCVVNGRNLVQESYTLWGFSPIWHVNEPERIEQAEPEIA